MMFWKMTELRFMVLSFPCVASVLLLMVGVVDVLSFCWRLFSGKKC